MRLRFPYFLHEIESDIVALSEAIGTSNLVRGSRGSDDVLSVQQLWTLRFGSSPFGYTLPKCRTELTPEHPVCEICGWSLPLPPGKTTPKQSNEAS